jgi:hypothetical protein
MARAFVNMRTLPLGFEPDRTVAMDIALGPAWRSGTIEQARAARLELYRQLSRSLAAVPGVQQVGFGFPLPFSGQLMNQPFSSGPGTPERQAEGIIALAGFMEMLRVPLISGRYFTHADEEKPVVIVEDRLARELYPHTSPLGQRLVLSRLPTPIAVEVVGVVSHVQMQPLRTARLPQCGSPTPHALTDSTWRRAPPVHSCPCRRSNARCRPRSRGVRSATCAC